MKCSCFPIIIATADDIDSHQRENVNGIFVCWYGVRETDMYELVRQSNNNVRTQMHSTSSDASCGAQRRKIENCTVVITKSIQPSTQLLSRINQSCCRSTRVCVLFMMWTHAQISILILLIRVSDEKKECNLRGKVGLRWKLHVLSSKIRCFQIQWIQFTFNDELIEFSPMFRTIL